MTQQTMEPNNEQVENQAAPVENQPAPVENQAAPVQNQPAPVESSSSGYTALMCSDEEIREYAQIFQDNLAGERLTERDLPRATVPSGGSRVWNIPGDEASDQPLMALRGVLVTVTQPRARWDKNMDEAGGGAPPVCSSIDGKIGVGNPGGKCQECPHNAWGSDGVGNGKSCKEKRMLYLLQKDNLLPLVVQAPSTSIESVKRYRLSLANQRQHYYGVETELSLERVDAGFPHSRIVLKKVGELSPDETEKAKTYIDAFSNVFQQATDLVADAESGMPENNTDSENLS